MFKQFEEQENRGQGSLVGTVDITDPDNLSLEKASISITHRDTQFPLHSPISEKVKPEDEMNTQQILNIFEKLNAEGVTHLTITGGEPTLRPDFRTIVQYAVNKFDEVLVQTNGTTDRNLAQHDITVSIPVEYLDPKDNNEVRRMTDPSKYIYDRKNEKVIRNQKTKSKLNGDVFDNKQKALSSIVNKTREQAIEFFNKKTGSDCESWDEVKESGYELSEIFLEREEPQDLYDRERALQLAMQKVENLPDDTPLIIRTNIYSNNNLRKVIAYGHMVDAQVVFKPLYPVGQNKRLLEQLPRPERFVQAMHTARDLNRNIKQDIRIDSPLYKAWKYEIDLEEKQQTDIDKETYLDWWKRGRVSDIGIKKIHIGPDGECMPTKYIRHNDYRLGNINNLSIQKLKQKMAEFNDEVMVDEDKSPVTEFGLRQRSIATDLNIALNKPYPNANINPKLDEKEVN